MMKMIRHGLLGLATACICLVSTSAAPTPKATNVLFIIADDLTKALECYGHPTVTTPNVNRIASRAVRFDRAYCQYPVCSPSRVSFLSGRRPEHTGMFGNEGESRTPMLKDAVFMPEHFKKNGYFTARVGKVFHIGRDVPECWDVTEEGTPDNKIIYQPSEVEKLGLTNDVVTQGRLQGGGGEGNSWTVTKASEEKLIDWQTGSRIAQLIDQGAKGNKPFFIACGFRRPHLPHLAPQVFFDGYPDSKVPMPLKTPVVYPSIKSAPSDTDTRDGMRSYLACVSFMDKQLGRVLAAMDRNNLWDTTVVIFLGDNGYHLGSRGGYWGKGTGYEESCCVPLLMAAPGKAKNTTCKRLVEYLDFYPTLLDLCGLPATPGIEGRSIRPLLEDPNATWDHPAYSMVAAKGKPSKLAVSTERYRLIENEDGKGSVELYDLSTDPHEWNNVAQNAAHHAELVKMQKLAKEHREQFWKYWETLPEATPAPGKKKASKAPAK
jgi:uncharacterized sulfatase